VQIGITVVSAAAAAVGGASIARWLEPSLARVEWLAQHSHAVSLGLVIVGISFLSVVVGELVPKSLALRSAERYALLIARPLLALSVMARPIVWLLSSTANLVLKPFGDRTTFTETRHSPDELRELVEEASEAGTIPPEAGEIASRALELPELTALEVMVPRQSVVAISRQITHDELRRVLLENRFSRLPVYDGTVDNVIGYITVKDVLALAWERDLLVLEDLLREPYFVLESKPVTALLTEMRAQHVPFAVVVDEHGGMSGIVTMEDVVEELVGEIFSEFSRQTPEPLEWQEDGAALVSGDTPIREINRSLDLELPTEGDWNTIAGLCLALAGRVPYAGEVFAVEGAITIEIVDASARRVRTVRIRVTGGSARAEVER
jgi:putative hemolysin